VAVLRKPEIPHGRVNYTECRCGLRILEEAGVNRINQCAADRELKDVLLRVVEVPGCSPDAFGMAACLKNMRDSF
jgi:hypothetical protein